MIATLFSVIGTPAFQKALAETAYAFSAGVAFAIVIGIPVGILMGKSRLAGRIAAALGECLSQRAADGAGAGADGAVRLRHEVDHHHDDAFRDLDHHPEFPRRRSPDQPVAGRNGPQLRRVAGGRVLQDLFLGGLAGNSGRRAHRRDPRREGRDHRPAADLDRRLRRVVRALFSQLPDVAFLGRADRALRAGLHDFGVPRLSRTPGVLLRRKAVTAALLPNRVWQGYPLPRRPSLPSQEPRKSASQPYSFFAAGALHG